MNSEETLGLTQSTTVASTVVVCTITYLNVGCGRWKFEVPGEGMAMVRDSQQIRALIGLLMSPGMVVEPEDVKDWFENGPCVVRHATIPPAGAQGKTADGQEDGDTSGDGDPDGSEEMVSPEDDNEPRLSRGEQWQKAIASDYWSHINGVLSNHTGTMGDDQAVRNLSNRRKLLKAGIAKMKQMRRVPSDQIATLEEELASLDEHRNDYVNTLSGGHRPFHLNKDAELLAQDIRMKLLRAIRSLAAIPDSSARLIGAVERGMVLTYNQDPRRKWQVMPFRRGSLPRLGKPNAKSGEAKVAA